ncbi:MAG: hypothetical protein HY536_01600 [Candidatus Colwellbacteria bacterium]|nr:hypothetical protein [Candidatus Colwellbacteria bacterium]
MGKQKLAYALIGLNILFLVVAIGMGIIVIGFVAKRLIGALVAGEAGRGEGVTFQLKAFEELDIERRE